MIGPSLAVGPKLVHRRGEGGGGGGGGGGWGGGGGGRDGGERQKGTSLGAHEPGPRFFIVP